MRMRVWSVLAVGLLLSACGGPKPQPPEKTKSGPPDTSSVEINGDASNPVNKLVIQAIADLEEYWGKEMPELYQKDFEPITGGYYAVNPSIDRRGYPSRQGPQPFRSLTLASSCRGGCAAPWTMKIVPGCAVGRVVAPRRVRFDAQGVFR